MAEFIPFLMFLAACLVLMAGYPVAFSLAGTALLFAMVGTFTGHFDMAFIQALPNRLFGTMENTTLIAVPLFILMGVMLEKSKLSEDLLESMADLFGEFRSGLGISVVLVGALLAASTGIVGATVVTMGLMSLPTMLKRGYSASQATGLIAATGTLGQIIPPSIALVLLGDTLSSAYQQAQLNMGIFTPKTISIGDLFVGALIPGLLLVIFYCVYLVLFSRPAEIDYEPQSAGRASLSSVGFYSYWDSDPNRGCRRRSFWCHSTCRD
jgi:tripartite ATP-independent transporter DctM subunit